jgi:hypothetical protein
MPPPQKQTAAEENTGGFDYGDEFSSTQERSQDDLAQNDTEPEDAASGT